MTAATASPRAITGLVVVGLGASLAPLDFAVNVAFPAITQAFSIAPHAIRWVAVCYVLTYGSLMLGFGALGDRAGYLRTFRAGVALGALAFVLCALAPTYEWLLAARVVQGVSAALTLSCAPAIATLLVDEQRRTWALSAYTGSAALAGVAAPILGGASIALVGWQGVYWFRVPIALASLACLPLLGTPAALEGTRARVSFDARDAIVLALSVALLLLGPSLLGPQVRAAHAILASLAGAALMAVFVHRQRGALAPFLPRALTRDAGFWLGHLGAIVVHFASFAVPLIVPYYLLHPSGGQRAPLESGALLALWAAGSLLGSSVATRVVAALGAPRTALGAALLATAGLASIAMWPAHANALTIGACLLAQGTGLGLFQVAYTDIVVAALPSARGVAGSLAMLTRTIGIVLGATSWIWILQSTQTAGLARGAEPTAAFTAGFHAVFEVAALVTAVFFASSAWRRSPWRDGPALRRRHGGA